MQFLKDYRKFKYVQKNISFLNCTLGSSEGVEQTCAVGQTWHVPLPAMEYVPFSHNVGGPTSEQLKPAGHGVQIDCQA